mgnify:CR=1 FL=1
MKDFKEALEDYIDLKETVDQLYNKFGQSKEIQKLVSDAKYTQSVLKCKGTCSMTVMAKELGMKSALVLQDELTHLGIIFKTQIGEFALTARYSGQELTKNKTLNFRGRSRHYLVWTEKGRRFLHSLKDRGYLQTSPMPNKVKIKKETKLVEVEKIGSNYSSLIGRFKDESCCMLALTKDFMKCKDGMERDILLGDVSTISRELINTIASLVQHCVSISIKK